MEEEEQDDVVWGRSLEDASLCEIKMVHRITAIDSSNKRMSERRGNDVPVLRSAASQVELKDA